MIQLGAALGDPRMFEPFFPGPSWDGWRAVVRGAFGERMTRKERAFFREVAKRNPPARRVKELWAIVGRRGGKDAIASGIVSGIAASFEADGRLRPGERAVVMLLALDKNQAQTVLNYIRAYFADVPALKAMVVRELVDGFELSNGVDIMILTNDYRSIRGRTVLAVVFDEVAYWRPENSASPDREVWRAVLPGMATLSESMLIGITTAYRRSGLAYDRWAKHFGGDSDEVLVVHASSRTINPTLSQSVIDKALEEDAAAARADYLSEFRDDLSSYLSRDLIEAAVDRGVLVRSYNPQHQYTSWIDASSGASDSFAAAVAHKEGNLFVLDALLEIRPPFNAANATAQVVAFLKQYGLRSTMGDDFAAGFVRAEMQRDLFGFEGRPTGMDRSRLYAETSSLYSSARARLLDSNRLVAQYAQLERRLLPGGHEHINHPNRSGHHDDLANVVAGAFWRLSAETPPMRIDPGVIAEIEAMGAIARMRGTPFVF